MRPKKIDAFTITELLVVMIIASVLLTAATQLYSNVSRYQIRLQQRIQHVNAVNRLQYLIAKDLNKSGDTHFSNPALEFKNSGAVYTFFKDSVVRVENQIKEVFEVGGKLAVDEKTIEMEFLLYDQVIKFPMDRKLAYRDQLNQKSDNSQNEGSED